MEAKATSHTKYSSQLSVQVEQLKTNLAAAESRASAHAAAADASNGEAALLRKQYAAVVAERQALNDRVIELAKAAAKVCQSRCRGDVGCHARTAGYNAKALVESSIPVCLFAVVITDSTL